MARIRPFQRLTRDQVPDHAATVATLRAALPSAPGEACRLRSRLGMLLLADPATFDEGFALLERVQAALRGGEDVHGLAVNTIRHGTALQYAGRHREAIARFDEAVVLIEAHSLSPLRDFALQHKGKCLAECGRLRDAERCLREALALRLAKGDAELVASTERAIAALGRPE